MHPCGHRQARNELHPGIFQHDELTVGAPIGVLVCASEL